ncbi:MAG: VanW family protein [Thermomicrobiales bacterium]|nr:VanW family protein [Thermomicrobiales bacterium]
MAQEPAALPIDVTGSFDRGSAADRERLWFNSRFSLVVSRAVLSLAMLILLAAAGLYVFRASYEDRIYPSIYVMGSDFGGMTYPEAKDALQVSASSLLNAELTFTYQERRWTPTFAEIGVELDSASTLNALFDIGRELDARDRVASTIDLVNGERAIPLTLSLNEAAFNAWLDQVDLDLGSPGQDAYLIIDDGEVTVVPDVDGIAVDRDRLRLLVVEGLGVNTPFAGALPVTADPANVHVADLEPALAQLDTALGKSIKLAHGKKRWKLTPADLGQFVVQTTTPGKRGAEAVELMIDRDALADYLSGLVRDEVNQPAKNARVAWSAKKDRLIAIEESETGASLRARELANLVIASFWSDHATVKVPITVIQPVVDSGKLDQLGITTRLAVGDSNFDGSDFGRSTNIAVGAQLLNGTLIAPKSEFTFNHAIGEITADKGYVESSVVDGERIGKDIGGGICQVSTTVFRAAFYAGLPITEWHPHRYRLGFYELDGWAPGLDASILQPEGNPFGGGDFKFENPTDSWMLVESYIDGPRVYVIIYGPDLGYDVRVSEPWYNQKEIKPTEDLEIVDENLPAGTIQQTEYALSGMEIGYQRTVYDRDGNLLWDRTFATFFYPRGNVYKVSPDMKGQSPAA